MDLRGYLLDTNIVNYWFNPALPEHDGVLDRISSLDANAPLRISVVTLGEIAYGHRCVSDTDTTEQAEFSEFVETRLPQFLTISKSTTVYYGQMRARLFRRFAPRNGRRALRLCQLTDPITGKGLGIQENDLWIAAQASEYNLVLVTHDQMRRIQEVAVDLVEFEDWVG